MVLDTSAVLAILMDEPERHRFNRLIADDPKRLLSAPSFVETAIVIEARHGEAGGRELDLFVHRAGIEIVPSDAGQAEQARDAWRDYGKGRHAAGLNFGDCFPYALARASGEALLFKGDDFSHTDIPAADPGPAG
ncbi:MAG: type II toxin-antitoxin system VapC family toxin [Alphaproteobacteria bacterium]